MTLRIALLCLRVRTNDLARFVADELMRGEKVVGAEEAPTSRLGADGMLRLKRTFAAENQRDHRFTEAESVSGLTLASGPGDEAMERSHGLKALRNVKHSFCTRFAQCQVMFWVTGSKLGRALYAFRLTF